MRACTINQNHSEGQQRRIRTKGLRTARIAPPFANKDRQFAACQADLDALVESLKGGRGVVVGDDNVGSLKERKNAVERRRNHMEGGAEAIGVGALARVPNRHRVDPPVRRRVALPALRKRKVNREEGVWLRQTATLSAKQHATPPQTPTHPQHTWPWSLTSVSTEHSGLARRPQRVRTIAADRKKE